MFPRLTCQISSQHNNEESTRIDLLILNEQYRETVKKQSKSKEKKYHIQDFEENEGIHIGYYNRYYTTA